MKTRLYILICVTTMALGSCTNKSRIENDYKNLVGSEIKIPYDSFDVVSYGLINDDRHKEWTFVSYVDSVECTPCHMSHVNQWERVQELFKKTGNGLRVVLIYCPRKQMVEDIKKNYRQSECSYVIYLDTMRRFMGNNPQIPENSKMHTMLLDSTGHVVFVGDPTRNVKVKELLQTYINSVRKSK